MCLHQKSTFFENLVSHRDLWTHYLENVQTSTSSSTSRKHPVPRTHNRFGDRSFAVAGPRLWNSLLISLRQISSYGQFRRYLKNHLFGIWEITAQCDAWFSALYKYSYLLTCVIRVMWTWQWVTVISFTEISPCITETYDTMPQVAYLTTFCNLNLWAFDFKN